jgi:NAD(P)H-flavin reductase/ferredoxin
MPQIQFNQISYSCEGEESVLDCLLRHDVEVPHACKKGTCHSCKMQVKQGQVSDESQRGLKDTEKAQGYFLACSCKPKEDLILAPLESQPSFETSVVEKTMLAEDIIRLRLASIDGFDYHAGQFVNIYKDEKVFRSYSIASVPAQDDFLEFHIKLYPNGLVSGWIHNELQVGDVLSISEARGESFYINDDLAKNILLIGTGTGLAPLYGVIKDALGQGHKGDLHLFHGSSEASGLYLIEELNNLLARFENFSYTPCVSGVTTNSDFTHGRANDLALAQYKDLKGWRVFLCGNPDMIEKTKLKVYLAGVSLHDILTDPFTVADTASS